MSHGQANFTTARPRTPATIAYTIPFAELQAHCDKLIAAGVRGRAVVKFP